MPSYALMGHVESAGMGERANIHGIAISSNFRLIRGEQGVLQFSSLIYKGIAY